MSHHLLLTYMSGFQIEAPPHVRSLLDNLHKLSIQQETKLKEDANSTTRFVSTDVLKSTDKEKSHRESESFNDLMRDKFIALDEDKCHFIYQLIRATGATNIVEAGTSFGVSTIYLALAVGENKKRQNGGKAGSGVIATENEPSKAATARKHWAQCGTEIEREIDLREGNLLETLSKDMGHDVDLLLLDSEC